MVQVEIVSEDDAEERGGADEGGQYEDDAMDFESIGNRAEEERAHE